ncbi:hypothetical protein C8F01DRAFT_1336158 [Mycena amicta]|nr:hypothetical protein C8F01DRAFT_1336158 [Mycena amicta]
MATLDVLRPPLAAVLNSRPLSLSQDLPQTIPTGHPPSFPLFATRTRARITTNSARTNRLVGYESQRVSEGRSLSATRNEHEHAREGGTRRTLENESSTFSTRPTHVWINGIFAIPAVTSLASALCRPALRRRAPSKQPYRDPGQQARDVGNTKPEQEDLHYEMLRHNLNQWCCGSAHPPSSLASHRTRARIRMDSTNANASVGCECERQLERARDTGKEEKERKTSYLESCTFRRRKFPQARVEFGTLTCLSAESQDKPSKSEAEYPVDSGHLASLMCSRWIRPQSTNSKLWTTTVHVLLPFFLCTDHHRHLDLSTAMSRFPEAPSDSLPPPFCTLGSSLSVLAARTTPHNLSAPACLGRLERSIPQRRPRLYFSWKSNQLRRLERDVALVRIIKEPRSLDVGHDWLSYERYMSAGSACACSYFGWTLIQLINVSLLAAAVYVPLMTTIETSQCLVDKPNTDGLHSGLPDASPSTYPPYTVKHNTTMTAMLHPGRGSLLDLAMTVYSARNVSTGTTTSGSFNRESNVLV